MSQQDALTTATKFVSLVNQSIPVHQAYLFGSYAKNSPDESSDIDICIVSPNLGKDLIDEMVILGKIAGQVDLRIEPHPMSPDDFNEKYNSLASEIKTYGIPLRPSD